MNAPPLPTLTDLGRDLLAVPRYRIAVSLGLPFLLFAGYFFAAAIGYVDAFHLSPAALGAFAFACACWRMSAR